MSALYIKQKLDFKCKEYQEWIYVCTFRAYAYLSQSNELHLFILESMLYNFLGLSQRSTCLSMSPIVFWILHSLSKH